MAAYWQSCDSAVGDNLQPNHSSANMQPYRKSKRVILHIYVYIYIYIYIQTLSYIYIYIYIYIQTYVYNIIKAFSHLLNGNIYFKNWPQTSDPAYHYIVLIRSCGVQFVFYRFWGCICVTTLVICITSLINWRMVDWNKTKQIACADKCHHQWVQFNLSELPAQSICFHMWPY